MIALLLSAAMFAQPAKESPGLTAYRKVHADARRAANEALTLARRHHADIRAANVTPRVPRAMRAPNGKPIYPTTAERDKAAEKAEAIVQNIAKRVESGDVVEWMEEAKVSEHGAGRLPTCRVYAVLGDRELIAEMPMIPKRREQYRGADGEVRSITIPAKDGELVVVTGYPTKYLGPGSSLIKCVSGYFVGTIEADVPAKYGVPKAKAGEPGRRTVLCFIAATAPPE